MLKVLIDKLFSILILLFFLQIILIFLILIFLQDFSINNWKDNNDIPITTINMYTIFDPLDDRFSNQSFCVNNGHDIYS